jgi:hypothetical protein
LGGRRHKKLWCTGSSRLLLAAGEWFTGWGMECPWQCAGPPHALTSTGPAPANPTLCASRGVHGPQMHACLHSLSDPTPSSWLLPNTARAATSNARRAILHIVRCRYLKLLSLGIDDTWCDGRYPSSKTTSWCTQKRVCPSEVSDCAKIDNLPLVSTGLISSRGLSSRPVSTEHYWV